MSSSRRGGGAKIKNVYTFTNLQKVDGKFPIDPKNDLLIINRPWKASGRNSLDEQQFTATLEDITNILYESGELVEVVVTAEPGENVIQVRTESTPGKVEYFLSAQVQGVPLDQYLSDTFLTIEDTLVEEITSNGVGTVGGVEPGYTFAVGTSLVEIMKKIFEKVVPATYQQSTCTISKSTSNTVEVGQVFTNTLTINYTQRDSGASVLGEFFINGVSSDTQNLPGPVYTFIAPAISMSNDGDTTSYFGEVDHLQGAQKFDNFGDPSGNPAIEVPARVNLPTINTVTVTARRNIFFGKNNPAPVDSDDVRALGNSQVSTDNTFDIVIGDGDTSVEFAIPNSKTLSLVIFRGALVSDETAIFQATEQIIPVAGATPGVDLDNYKVYRYVPNIPFESAAVYEVTLT